MRYLGLDLGSKTLGISLSDRTNTIASVLKTIRFDEDDYETAILELKPIIEEYQITDLVLGLPKNMNNTLSTRANICLSFQKKLEKTYPVTVHLEDERLTSVISNQILIDADLSRKKRKQKVDGMSAVLILQSYLDRQK